MNRSTNGVHKQKNHRFNKALNAYKNTEYSSIYTTIAFIETIVITIIGGIWTICIPESKPNILWIRYLIELITMVIMIICMHLFTKKSRKKCESRTGISEQPQGSRIASISQGIGYISPVICVLAWIVSINGLEIKYKIGALAVSVILALIILLVKPISEE